MITPRTPSNVVRHFIFGLALLGIWYLGSGCATTTESSSEETAVPTPSQTAEALAQVDQDWLLAQVTRAPKLLELPTLTEIPTITATPRQTDTPIPTEAIRSTLDVEAEVTRFRRATQTPTPEPSPTEIALDLGPTSTPALPNLPAILPTPFVTYTVRVPILMYHYVSTPPEDANKYRVNLSVEPDDFRQQMAFIREQGYQVIDLYDIIDPLVRSEEPPEKSVVLTFDDGYIDNYEIAFPILEEFGYTGTFFIVTEFVDFGVEGYMTWEMIEEMAAAGHRFESHTKSHPDLSNLKRSDLVWQILGSQETLAAHIGYKPQFLSYPSGRYNEETIELVEELSLWGAVTTRGGMWRSYYDRYEWTRTRVSYTTTLEDLEKVLID